MRRKIITVLILCLTLFANCAYADNPLTKLGRGFTNAAFSLVEIPTNIQKSADVKGTASGFFDGFFLGIYYMCGRLLTGVYDVATFPIPLPYHYKPLMRPAYVFQAAGEA